MIKTVILSLVLAFVCNVSIAQYFIVFRANPATSIKLPGHAFASFVKKDESLNQTVVEHTWGFHPIEKSFKAIFSTEGEVETTKIGDLGKSDFVVEVDPITYDYCKKLKDKWESKKYGVVGSNPNCVDFVKQIAELITPELVIPNIIYQYPRPFLDKLRTLNSKRDSYSRESLSEITKPQKNPASPSNPIVESKPVESTPTNKNLLGGQTPEELGIILLKALQKNDKTTWVRCINPEREESAQVNMAKSFQEVRTQLEDAGLSDWKQVQFSRTAFNRNNDYRGRKGGSNFTIEFRYKNDEFIGQIVFGSISTATNGDKYLIWGGPYMDHTGLIRNTKR